MLTRRAAFIASIALAGLCLSGCTAGRGGEPDSTPTTTPESTDVFAIAVGDCVTDQDADGAVISASVIPCTDPHQKEAYQSILLPDGDFPGDEAISAEATTQCEEAFGTFVGIAYRDSKALNVTWYNPTPTTWASGDREILCLVFAVDVNGAPTPTVGSLENANR